MIDLKELQNLYEKSTQGEWIYKAPREQCDFGFVDCGNKVISHSRNPDAAFIAAAHNNFAELLKLAEKGD